MPTLSLEQLLTPRSVEGLLYEKLPGQKVRCHACAHRCRIPEGKKGICKVRWNEKGILKVPRNYVGALQVDPIEKKPFFHVLPGTKAFSFGMLGCDYHCDYCQNWLTSQALRDPRSEKAAAFLRDVTARELADLALARGCGMVTSTYNEPLITSEWAVEVFQESMARGLLTSYVSNGNATKETLEFIRPYVDAYKVDLKSLRDPTYRRRIGGTLAPVLETIERLKRMGVWVEVVTLVVPGLNDSEKELSGIARFIASIDRDIPWHVTAFHPDYRMEETPGTKPEKLAQGWRIGKEAGLRFVYSGNKPGEVGATENTGCPSCGKLLVERVGFSVVHNYLKEDGLCPGCSAAIPGIWKIPSRIPHPTQPVEVTVNPQWLSWMEPPPEAD